MMHNWLTIWPVSVPMVIGSGILSCPPALNFEQGRTLELPLKPLLHIAFITIY